jgi:uncharacterized cupin superfamily protein
MVKPTAVVLGVLAAMLIFGSSLARAQADVPLRKVTAADAQGAVFTGPDAVRRDIQGLPSADVSLMISGDRKFQSGLFKAGARRFEFKDRGYGVDEFMLIISGSATPTVPSGSKITLSAGDAITIPAEWRGVWETPGLTKYYVIYSRDKPIG